MSEFAPLLSLFVVGMTTALMPGPTFLMVSQIAMSRSRGQAMLAVLGIVTSGLLWASATLIGLAALFAALPWSQLVLQIAGGCYLINLGIRSWHQPALAEGSPVTAARGSAYLRGLMTDLLNPKCLAFFASIFALFVPSGSPLWIKVGAVGVVTVIGFTCYGAVAVLFSTAAVRNRYLALSRPIERVCGTVMLVFGLALLLARA
ncbi:MAG: LysE family transporter [Alphaproteobacteria bacterium]|nr:LysE family transporter [Alphaproteobacteria bacterium]